METKNRNVWIVVAIVLVLLCCCVAAVAAAATWVVTTLPADLGLRPASLEDWGVRPDPAAETVEQSFQVGTAPALEVDNFAGDVTVRAGASGTIAVVATKRATPGAELGQVTIQMQEQDGGIAIKTEKPFSLSNASVDLEIVAPADARLDLRLGAGKVEIEGLNNGIVVDNGAGNVTIADATGSIQADSGAGSLDLRGVAGPVRLQTGAGSIDYQGAPEGECRFESGAGSITLLLPPDLGAELDLETGIGDIDIEFVVDGQVTGRKVSGTIGVGQQARIYAHTGTGSIRLGRR